MILLGDHEDTTLDQLVDALVELRSSGLKFCVVASSDMLHDPDYDYVARYFVCIDHFQVTNTDRATLALIEKNDFNAISKAWSYEKQILCGVGPVLTLMRFANRVSASGHVLHYCNCGDVFPESKGDWVVGYGAVAFV